MFSLCIFLGRKNKATGLSKRAAMAMTTFKRRIPLVIIVTIFAAAGTAMAGSGKAESVYAWGLNTAGQLGTLQVLCAAFRLVIFIFLV